MDAADELLATPGGLLIALLLLGRSPFPQLRIDALRMDPPLLAPQIPLGLALCLPLDQRLPLLHEMVDLCGALQCLLLLLGKQLDLSKVVDWW